MMGYTGKPHRATPAAASAANVRWADSGGRRNFAETLNLIVEYVAGQATQHYEGDAKQVPCPTKEAWAELSAGRQAVLPNDSQLRLYATAAMWRLAEKLNGDLQRAYFEAARYKLLHRKSQ